MLFEPLAPPSRRMPTSACGALSTDDSLLFSTTSFAATKIVNRKILATSAAGTGGLIDKLGFFDYDTHKWE
ncbi:hypothetical protein [Dictyobacter vulcani]|uniref:hypothetical protein n=1 Tax=Dictyobacter vulcani TaxID=2607529 RepID=UPI001250B0C9|nr:hypothetical protein [Dictyobacter vulcani]